MTSTIERRLGKVEATIEAREPKRGIEWQMGYCQELPDDVGEKHVAIVSRLPNGYYEWEERPGPRPVDDGDDSGTIFRLFFVGTKPYKLGDAWRELEEERTQPEAIPAPEQRQPVQSVAEVPSPDAGDPLARIRAILATPPPPPTETQMRFRPSPPPPPWSWA